MNFSILTKQLELELRQKGSIGHLKPMLLRHCDTVEKISSLNIVQEAGQQAARIFIDKFLIEHIDVNCILKIGSEFLEIQLADFCGDLHKLIVTNLFWD